MPEKKDPIIRALVIIIIGTIAFGLLFSLLTGGGDMDHMGNMGGSGYNSLGVSLGGLLFLFIKLLLVVLVIAIVVGVVIWIKNSFFKNSSGKFMQAINNDPILKTIVYVTLGIIGLVIVFGLLGSMMNTGYGYGMDGSMMNGIFTTFSVASIMALLIKVLSFVLVISLILALVAYIKKQYDAGAFKGIGGNGHTGTQDTAQKASTSDTEGKE